MVTRAYEDGLGDCADILLALFLFFRTIAALLIAIRALLWMFAVFLSCYGLMKKFFLCPSGTPGSSFPQSNLTLLPALMGSPEGTFSEDSQRLW